MSPRAAVATIASIAMLGCAAPSIVGASAAAQRSSGSREQIAWVRRAASNFVGAELAGNGAGACAILYAPLRASSGHRTCTQRWDAKLAAMLHAPGARASLRADMHAISSAPVDVHEYDASIDLPRPLLGGGSSFVWSENCWMLRG